MMSEYHQPYVIELPFQSREIVNDLSYIDEIQLRITMERIMLVENQFPFGVLPRVLWLFLLGVILMYLGLLLVTLTLFNVVLIAVVVTLLYKYLQMAVGLIRTGKRKIYLRNMKK